MNPPPVEGVLETVLYCRGDQIEDMRRFYAETLGLRAVFGDHPIAFRVGHGVLLIFDTDTSRLQDAPPPHGSTGPAHACLLADEDSYERWKLHLESAGVDVKSEIGWPGGRRSFYFDDPAGNVLEIADGDFWPR
ncbi:MAG: VOC family protein [Actinomycetota bacterium]